MRLCCSRNGGYVLSLALGLVGLLSLLSLAFAVHIRLESARVAGGLDHERARMVALYGLAEGFAAVRQAAGRDTVVTAPWEDSDGEVATGWAGVWDTGDGSLVDILVSGLDGACSDWQEMDSVTMAWRGGEGIQAVLIDGEAGGRYAWWVDDEGRKAALWSSVPVSDGDGVDVGLLGQVLAPVAGLPPTAEVGNDQSDGESEHYVLRSRLVDLAGLCYDSAWQASDATALAAAYTVSSRGVLSDTQAGGLRRNLADGDGVAEADGWSASLRSVLRGRVGEGGMLEPIGMADAADGDELGARLENVPRPVVTEVGIYMWLARHPAPRQHNLKVHLTVRLNLWNPYAARLRGGGEGDDPALLVALGRLPPMVVEWSTGDGAQSGLFQLNPTALVWRLDSSQLAGPLVELERLPLFYPHLDPGEVRTFSIRLTGLLDEELVDPTPHRYTDDNYSLRAAAGDFDFCVRLPDGSLVVEFQRLSFVGAGSSDYRVLPLRAVSMTGSPVYGDAALLWHWALLEEAVWSTAGEAPSAALRAGRFAFAADDDHDQLAGIYRLTQNPGAGPLDLQIFPGRPAVFYGGNGSLARNTVVLYDYATTHPASLAYALHIPLVDGHATEGNTRYEIFDRFYYHPAADDLSPGERWLFGNRYSALADCADCPPLLLGAFNINSTSVEAWRAVLASRPIQEWSYRGLSSPRLAGNLANTVFRFPHCAGFVPTAPWDMDAAYPNGHAATRAEWYRESWVPQWMRAWAGGIRLLSDAETMALAGAIVAQLRQRPQPFFSLAEAAGEPWLQQALDQTTINVVGDKPYVEAEERDRIPRHSPSFVSQADLIALLAPFWAVRSDTFTIRAYGRVDSPDGGTAAEVWCEARVQRLPTGDKCGRPFVIEHFRWLYSNEL